VSLCFKMGKERYSSRVAARRAVRRWHGNDTTLSVYYCHSCFSFHYGHHKPRLTPPKDKEVQ
jgi:hypothetical protein